MKTDTIRRNPRTGRFEKSEKLHGDEKTAADRSDEIEHDLYGSDDDVLPPADPALIGTEYGPRPANENPISAARGCFIGVFLVGCVVLAVLVAVWARSVH